MSERTLAGGFYLVLLVYFGGLTIALSRSSITPEAKLLPYITAAIALPLVGFKLLKAASPTIHSNVARLKRRFGFQREAEDVGSPITRGEAGAALWVALLVGSTYVLGLIPGMFLSIFAFISYREEEYLKAALIAFVVAGAVYVILPVLFNELLWDGLLLTL